MRTPIEQSNLALSIALFLAGVRPAQEDHFAAVAYDEKFLVDHKCATIPEALAKDVRGHIKCFFHPDDAEQVQFLKAIWDDEKERIEKNLDSDVGEVAPEVLIRIVARTLHARKQLTQQWQKLPIYAILRNAGDVEDLGQDGERVVLRHPGYIMVNIKASEKIKQRLGLK